MTRELTDVGCQRNLTLPVQRLRDPQPVRHDRLPCFHQIASQWIVILTRRRKLFDDVSNPLWSEPAKWARCCSREVPFSCSKTRTSRYPAITTTQPQSEPNMTRTWRAIFRLLRTMNNSPPCPRHIKLPILTEKRVDVHGMNEGLAPTFPRSFFAELGI